MVEVKMRSKKGTRTLRRITSLVIVQSKMVPVIGEWALSQVG